MQFPPTSTCATTRSYKQQTILQTNSNVGQTAGELWWGGEGGEGKPEYIYSILTIHTRSLQSTSHGARRWSLAHVVVHRGSVFWQITNGDNFTRICEGNRSAVVRRTPGYETADYSKGHRTRVATVIPSDGITFFP